MDLKQGEVIKAKSSIEEPPELELKDLPSHLEYAYLEGNDKLPVIIAKGLKDVEKEALLKVLKSHKRAIAWKITDIKGIDPRFCTHKILMEDDYKPMVQSQRRVNPKIHEEKTTFTCPYGTFAYCRMPFGLCNAPGTFQRCMMAIFHDMIEKTMEIFMDDFSVFGDSFDLCLSNLEKMLKRCEDTNLVLNWEKCHFMCRKGNVLGHKISKSGIEVDHAKVDVIAKLPYPTTIKGVRSFLGHAEFKKNLLQGFAAALARSRLPGASQADNHESHHVFFQVAQVRFLMDLDGFDSISAHLFLVIERLGADATFSIHSIRIEKADRNEMNSCEK
ncbi:reverse transcriptase domain-containing protein [Tanacetum coccineum]